MPSWLLLLVSLCALAAGTFALLRANRVDAAMRRALRELPAAAPSADGQTVVPLPDVQGALSRVAVVRYDAFADISGKLSSSAAVLDVQGNGLVITTMNGRESTRSYLKAVRRGIGVAALSPEEADAVARAMKNASRVS